MKRSFALRTQRIPFRRQRAVIVGLGPIGLEVARLVLAQPEVFQLAGVVDCAPRLAGRALGDVLGRHAPPGRVLEAPPAQRSGEGLAFLTTTSSIRSVTKTIEALLAAGYHIVSSTEELSYPMLREPHLAARLDRAARRARRCVVGSGINPGFAMDVWPLVLASNMQTLHAVHVTRVVDASQRREPLQRKVGAGLTRREFETLARAGRIGHVGLVESGAHLAAALGWSLDSLRENLTAKLATRHIRTASLDVRPGQVCGIHHRVVGSEGRRRRVTLDLQMYLGADDPRDEVVLEGQPPIRCVVPGGFHGDRTTASQLLSAALRIRGMPPGLHLPSDLPTPRRSARPLHLSFATSSR
ncbi:MAG: dihydrodipicolinate reductase [Candidatus Krumholzibacteriia bacterium]